MLYQNDGRIIGGKNIKGDGMMKRLFSNRDLTKLIIPLIIEQFLLIFVGLADSVMVASVGEEAVSAVSLIDSVMILLINAFTALATGGAIVAGIVIYFVKRMITGMLTLTMMFDWIDTLFYSDSLRPLTNLFWMLNGLTAAFAVAFYVTCAVIVQKHINLD